LLRRAAVLGACVAAAVVSSSPARAAKPAAAEDKAGLAAQPNQVRGDEITPAQQESVRKGLAWLAAHQQKDGAFGAGGGSN
jgi:hypothetical protein